MNFAESFVFAVMLAILAGTFFLILRHGSQNKSLNNNTEFPEWLAGFPATTDENLDADDFDDALD